MYKRHRKRIIHRIGIGVIIVGEAHGYPVLVFVDVEVVLSADVIKTVQTVHRFRGGIIIGTIEIISYREHTSQRVKAGRHSGSNVARLTDGGVEIHYRRGHYAVECTHRGKSPEHTPVIHIFRSIYTVESVIVVKMVDLRSFVKLIHIEVIFAVYGVLDILVMSAVLHSAVVYAREHRDDAGSRRDAGNYAAEILGSGQVVDDYAQYRGIAVTANCI